MNTTNAQFEKLCTVMEGMIKPFIFEIKDILPEADLCFVFVKAACIVLLASGLDKQPALEFIKRSLNATYDKER